VTDPIRYFLEWVTAVLLGRRKLGRYRRPSLTCASPALPQVTGHPSPDVSGARLVAARRHRARRAPDVPTLPEPRAQWFPPAPWERPLSPVRPYLLSHLGEEWRHVVTGKGA
jgi:hypothetical protein